MKPRQKRIDEADAIDHALHPGNARQTIFHKHEVYEAFISVLANGLFVFVYADAESLTSRFAIHSRWTMGRFLRWVAATHSSRYHAHYHTRGEGHIYQARYKSFPAQDDSHFYVLCRYVERTPVRAKLVERAEN